MILYGISFVPKGSIRNVPTLCILINANWGKYVSILLYYLLLVHFTQVICIIFVCGRYRYIQSVCTTTLGALLQMSHLHLSSGALILIDINEKHFCDVSLVLPFSTALGELILMAGDSSFSLCLQY